MHWLMIALLVSLCALLLAAGGVARHIWLHRARARDPVPAKLRRTPRRNRSRIRTVRGSNAQRNSLRRSLRRPPGRVASPWLRVRRNRPGRQPAARHLRPCLAAALVHAGAAFAAALCRASARACCSRRAWRCDNSRRLPCWKAPGLPVFAPPAIPAAWPICLDPPAAI